MSPVFLMTFSYYKNTEVRAASGGKYSEGMVGSPRVINPIYASASDVDRDRTEIVFTVTGEPDVAPKVEIYSPGGRLVARLTADRLHDAENGWRVTWEGQDNNGREVANGVYFVKAMARRDGRMASMKQTVGILR